MKNVKLGVMLLGLLAAASGAASAQDDPGLLIGGSGGVAAYASSCKGGLPIAVPCHDHDVAWRVFGGYRFNRTWSVELGYVDAGDVKGDGDVGGVPSKFKRETRGFDLSAVFVVPLVGNLHALGRLGAYSLRTVVDLDNAGMTSSAANTNSGLTYGLGAGYDLGRLGLRAEWQRYPNVGNSGTGVDDVDVFSLGLLFRF